MENVIVEKSVTAQIEVEGVKLWLKSGYQATCAVTDAADLIRQSDNIQNAALASLKRDIKDIKEGKK